MKTDRPQETGRLAAVIEGDSSQDPRQQPPGHYTCGRASRSPEHRPSLPTFSSPVRSCRGWPRFAAGASRSPEPALSAMCSLNGVYTPEICMFAKLNWPRMPHSPQGSFSLYTPCTGIWGRNGATPHSPVSQTRQSPDSTRINDSAIHWASTFVTNGPCQSFSEPPR